MGKGAEFGFIFGWGNFLFAWHKTYPILQSFLCPLPTSCVDDGGGESRELLPGHHSEQCWVCTCAPKP